MSENNIKVSGSLKEVINELIDKKFKKKDRFKDSTNVLEIFTIENKESKIDTKKNVALFISQPKEENTDRVVYFSDRMANRGMSSSIEDFLSDTDVTYISSEDDLVSYLGDQF